MKDIFRCLINHSLVMLIYLVCLSVTQAQQGWIAGAGPSIELDQGSYGVNARLFYGIDDSFCFGPEVAFFPYKEINDEYELTIIDLNFNTHYIFEVSEKLGLYPLTGINYTIEKERSLEFQEEGDRENEFGWNYGIGAHYNFSNFFVFTEFKGIAGSLNDEFVTIGAVFFLSRRSEKTKNE